MNTLLALDDAHTVRKSIVDYKKSQYQRLVLTNLYQEGICTLPQLAARIHSSVPSVTGLVEQLVEEHWITATGLATGKNGRRPILYGLNTQSHLVAVLDISTHDTKVLILNLQREVIFRRDCNLRLDDNPSFLETLTDFTAQTLDESGLARTELVAIGVSIPGLVDTQTGFNLTYKNLNQADDSLMHHLKRQFQLPVYVINDTKASALGENRFGSARDKKYVLAINIDWGVGLGIILNGEVFQGASGFAGELGHIQVEPDGELCYCGKVGCLDTLTSASALVRRVQRGIAEGRVSQLAIFQDDVHQIDIDKVIEAAHQGDSFAIDTLHEASFQLGKGLAIAINLFNPEIIIVDGVLTRAAPFIISPIEQAINKYCMGGFRTNLTIEISQLQGTAKWLGTHAHVIENLIAQF